MSHYTAITNYSHSIRIFCIALFSFTSVALVGGGAPSVFVEIWYPRTQLSSSRVVVENAIASYNSCYAIFKKKSFIVVGVGVVYYEMNWPPIITAIQYVDVTLLLNYSSISNTATSLLLARSNEVQHVMSLYSLTLSVHAQRVIVMRLSVILELR